MDNQRPHLIDLPKILDARGNLTFLESAQHVPFQIQRAYWLYDVPGGEVRGGHAYRQLQEVIIALSGSFDIVVDDSRATQKYSLNRSYFGLYVPAGYWRRIENFSTNALALIVASLPYDADDYIRDYTVFQTSQQP